MQIYICLYKLKFHKITLIFVENRLVVAKEKGFGGGMDGLGVWGQQIQTESAETARSTV